VTPLSIADSKLRNFAFLDKGKQYFITADKFSSTALVVHNYVFVVIFIHHHVVD